MMLSHLSKTSGIGGTIKSVPEDFLVEEIGSNGTIFQLDNDAIGPNEGGRFTHFILQKKNWSTSSAIYEVAKKLGVGNKRFSIAGTKDKIAISTQLVSAFEVPRERLLDLRIKDIKINGAWSAKEKIRLGQLLGNRFTIKVRGAKEDSSEKVARIQQELGDFFPNYFGEQRFGTTRRNTHLIGKKLLQGKMEDAVRLFLIDTEGETNSNAVEARKALAESGDYNQALKTFPKHLRLERTVIAYLDKYPGNYANALRRLPRSILLLFVHAFQSHLFNLLLSKRLLDGTLELEEGEYYCGETHGFPDIRKCSEEGDIAGKLIGYESPLNPREEKLLDDFGIRKEDFKMKFMPELASKGTYRILLAPLKDLHFSKDTFRFSLAAGCYATMALREFIDLEKTR